MSAEQQFSPGDFMIVQPRPKANVWVRNGEVTAVIVTDCPERMSLEPDVSILMFTPEFEVTVHEVRP